MSGGGAISLSDGSLELEVLPELGGKVAALRCRRHGRQWLAPRGDGVEPSADEATYGPAEAWGWDELFPSVLAVEEPPPPWPGSLRDHGELWGRPWRVAERGEGSLRLAFEDAERGFRFERLLELGGGAVRCRYELSSSRPDAVPFQWSMHPIFALRPGERLRMAGVDRVKATIPGHHLLPDGPASVGWPEHNGLDLGLVRPADGETLLKLYAEPPDGVVAVAGGECELRLGTDREFAPHVGIYVNYGGWPEGGPLHHVGIEPTTAPEDDLAAALASGHAAVLAPGESRAWTVELRLGQRCVG